MSMRYTWNLCRFSNKCKQQTLLTLIAFIVVLMFNVQFNKPVFHYYKNLDTKSACVLPKFNIHDSSIAEFFWEVNPLQCESIEPLMFIDSDGFVRVNQTLKSAYKYSTLNCLCQPVVWINDETVTFGESLSCTNPVYIANDFVYAKCTNRDAQVYDGLLYWVDYKSIMKSKNLKNESEENLSVYFYGYDALSNLIARRTMPLTLKYLEDNLEAYTFNGYTKVGDNTWPNLISLLTGNRTEPTSKLEEIPFIWNDFSRNGYATLFSEDYPRLFSFKGFKEKPADHFNNPFFMAADKVKPITNRDVRKVILFMEYKNMKVGDSSYLCVGNTPKHKIVIEYYKSFIKTYKNLRKFGFTFNTELGHDYINFYNHADKDSSEFFQWMHQSGHLDNAVLIFYSDHGPRYSEIQNTNIGRVTGMLPIFSMFIPKHIKERYPSVHENLLKNTERLTTAFDVYKTLKDILKGKFIQDATTSNAEKGISLFRPIPEKRSCYDANIPEHYCPCYSSQEVDVKSKRVQEMANVVLTKINAMLQKHMDKCATLRLKSTLSASLVKSNFERDKSMEERFSIRSYIYSDKQDTRYLLVIQTEPGDAKFESTVHYGESSGIEVSGDINRINRYGNQSHCMNIKLMRLYCFCK